MFWYVLFLLKAIYSPTWWYEFSILTPESNSHFQQNLNEEGVITSHLMCANFFMINLNVIITFMLQLFNNNREALAKHVTYTLSQYPGRIQPGKILSETLSRKITPRRKTFGFFTSLTILHNLFHPGKNTASLVVPSEFLDYTRWILILPLWYYWTPWCFALSHWNYDNAR